MDYELLYDSEDFSVLLPDYLSDSVSDSSEIGEKSETVENSEYSEDSGSTGSVTLDSIYSNQVLIMESIDNLNNNVCILNENVVILHQAVLYGVGIVALLLFFKLVDYVIRIFNGTLGLGKV